MRWVYLGLREVVFWLKGRPLVFLVSLGITSVYMPAFLYQAALKIKDLPGAGDLLAINAVLGSLSTAVFVAALAASFVQEEKISGVWEYFVAYTPDTAGKILAAKLLAASLVSALFAVPYIAAVGIIFYLAGVPLGSSFLLLLPTALFAAVSFSLAVLLATLVLESKYASVLNLVVILAVVSAPGILASESPTSFNVVAVVNLISLAVLAASMAAFVALKDKIIELSLR